MAGSRATQYSFELATEIAARFAEGESLKTICKGFGMPSHRTLVRWRHSHPEFDQMLLRALFDKADVFFEESIDIADEVVSDATQVMRNKLRVQARQWAAARLNPARYSERLALGAAPELPKLGQDEPIADRALARRVAYAMRVGLNQVTGPQSNLVSIDQFLELAVVIKKGLDITRGTTDIVETPSQLPNDETR